MMQPNSSLLAEQFITCRATRNANYAADHRPAELAMSLPDNETI
jgi:hypothetical protein